MTLSAGTRSLLLFLFSIAFILAICYLIIVSEKYASDSELFSLAITIDVVFFIPLLYFLFIRKRSIPKITLVPVAFLAWFAASAILPSADHDYLEKAKLLMAPLELFAIGFIIYKVRIAATEYRSLAVEANDFLHNVRDSLYKTIGIKRAADIFSTEISVLYYGLFGWFSEIEKGPEAGYSYHKRSGYGAIVGTFFFLILIETFSLHLLISRWSIAGAWILTALSIYSILFIFADYNAARKRPILIDDRRIRIRIGFRWTVTIPFEKIRSVQPAAIKKRNDNDYLRMVLIGRENVMIEMSEPVQALGLYGISKEFTYLGLFIDEKNEFVRSLQSKTNPPSS